MIRGNTDDSIFCVCYTNHALDQFLEHLHNNGENKIVRIGGRSKSKKLQKYNLRELMHQKISTTSDERYTMNRLYAQLCKCQENISELSSKIEQNITWDSPDGGVSEILAEEEPEIYDLFVSIENNPDGFSIVGKGNKKVTVKDCFQNWADGCDCPTYLKPYVELHTEFDKFWKLDKATRNELLNGWRERLFEVIRDDLKKAILLKENLSSERQAIYSMQGMEILKHARVIGGKLQNVWFYLLVSSNYIIFTHC
jgi:hypothetical protein